MVRDRTFSIGAAVPVREIDGSVMASATYRVRFLEPDVPAAPPVQIARCGQSIASPRSD